jgi:catechol 2,3-dioxygenase-like lactoylglutathione lyase family enzyme
MPKSDNHGALYRVSPRDTSFYDDFLGYVMSIIPSTMTEFIWAPLTPELIVTDIKASLRFWRDLCGFRVAFERPNKGFAYLDLDGAQIMLEERDQSRNWIVGPMEPPFGRGINFQIGVREIEPILDSLAAADWPLFLKPEEKWYRTGDLETGVRQFLVQDPDGYLVRFSARLGQRRAP